MFFVESLSLMIFAAFRIATIARCPEPWFRQRLGVLSGCTPLRQPYTPAGILLSRSFARPLVRGESGPIRFVRACLLWCIALGVPVFGLIAIIFMPTTTQVYSKYVSPFQMDKKTHFDSPPGNATLLLTGLNQFSETEDSVPSNIQTRILTTELKEVDCKTTSSQFLFINGAVLIQCPYGWSRIMNVSLSLSFPHGITGVNVVPIQGTFIGPNNHDLLTEWLNEFGGTLDGVPLFTGSKLAGAFTWTQTDVNVNTGWSLFSPATMAVYTADIRGLQSVYPGNGTSDPDFATLTLVQRHPNATRQFIDTPDSTVLNGIATFGGFWTFLNGAFALFFGANVLYFAFGRRPLSALGLVHVFQRRRLQRQWNEDFPAIHTEGGLPGSESAGIVAFIRQRLVDLGEDPHRPVDVESQKTSGTEENRQFAECRV
ncbi:hypothetical protein C8F04DRAFT_1405093 [Mycena alexandri]|uniref:Uncharacterized protein n=1 Tax=Mycena alexandri TaxID=1745969 RepID=A0AAD6RZ56_9AGAR|nr:hypothetical protein C8F04DRAFT_1405093 [Mycena alexandri]